MNTRRKVASLLSGWFAALLVVAAVIFNPVSASALSEDEIPVAQGSTHSWGFNGWEGEPGDWQIRITINGSIIVYGVPDASGIHDLLAEWTVPADTPIGTRFEVRWEYNYRETGWELIETSVWVVVDKSYWDNEEETVTPAPSVPEQISGTVETAAGGVALPGGGNSVPSGGLFRARITAGANEEVTITVTLPGGGGAPGIAVAGTASRTVTTDASGNAFFNVRVPRATPTGTGTVVGTDASGTVIFFSEFQIAGRAVHPAAG